MSAPMSTQQATLHTSAGDITSCSTATTRRRRCANFVELATGAREWTHPGTGAKTSDPLLQRHGLPPGDPRLHDPGRRPARARATAAPATSSPTSSTPSSASTVPTCWRWPTPAPNTNGSQFFITVGAHAAPEPQAHHLRRGRRRREPRRGRRDRQHRDRPARQADDAGDDRVGDRGVRLRSVPAADDRDRGGALLPPSQPRGRRALHALRPADLPGVHAPGVGRLPLPGRRRDRADSTQRPLRNSVGAVLRDSPPVRDDHARRPQRRGLPRDRAAVAARHQPARVQPAVPATGSCCPTPSTTPTSTSGWSTAAFLHANLLHIAVNMLSLVFVGPYLERVDRLVALRRWCTCCRRSAGRPRSTRSARRCVPVVGASGALFGLLGACLVLVRRLSLDLQYLIGIIVLNFVFTFSVAGHLAARPHRRLRHRRAVRAGDRRLAERCAGASPDRCNWPGFGGVVVLVVLVVAVRTAAGGF